MTRTKRFDSAACQIVYGKYVNGLDVSLSIKRALATLAQQTLRQRCRYKRCQLISIQFYRLQSKLLKRTTATTNQRTPHRDRSGSRSPSPGWGPDDERPHTLLQFSVSTRLGLARPAGHCINERQHAKQSKARQGQASLFKREREKEREGGRGTRHGETFEPLPKLCLCLCLCGCNTLQAQAVPYVARKLLPLMTAITFIVLAITIK